MSDISQATTTFAETSRFARMGAITGLLGAGGRVGQVLRDLSKEEAGETGTAIKELNEELRKYTSFVGSRGISDWDNRVASIVQNLQDLPSLRYLNRPTLAAVIIFLHISGSLSGGDINPQPHMFDINGPFDAVYAELIQLIAGNIPTTKIKADESEIVNRTTTSLRQQFDSLQAEEQFEAPVKLDDKVKLKFKQTFVRYIHALHNYVILKRQQGITITI